MKPFRASCSSLSVRKAVSVLGMIDLFCAVVYLALAVFITSLSLLKSRDPAAVLAGSWFDLADPLLLIIIAAGVFVLLKNGACRAIPAGLFLLTIESAVNLIQFAMYSGAASAGDGIYLAAEVILIIASGLLFLITQDRLGRRAGIPAAVLLAIGSVLSFYQDFEFLPQYRGSLLPVAFLLSNAAATACECVLLILIAAKFGRTDEGTAEKADGPAAQ